MDGVFFDMEVRVCAVRRLGGGCEEVWQKFALFLGGLETLPFGSAPGLQ